MKIGLLALAPLVLLAAVLSAPPQARAADVSGRACPHEKASQVDARIDWKGKVRKCGVGLSLFGLRISALRLASRAR